MTSVIFLGDVKMVQVYTCIYFVDLHRYQGTFCGQDVAIKVLSTDRLNETMKEFAQEVSILRLVMSLLSQLALCSLFCGNCIS